MATVRMSYVQAYADRHGKMRYYYRRPGYPRVSLPSDPGSVEFAQAYQKAGETRRKIGEDRVIPGTFSALIAEYYESATFAGHEEITRRTYRNVLEKFRKTWGNCPVKEFTPSVVDKLIESKPKNLSTLRKVLNLILKLAVRREWIDYNPLAGVRISRKPIKGFRDWTDGEIAQFEAHWPTGSRERLALALLLYTLQRRSDVVVMGRQHMKPGKIHVAQAKGGGETRLWLPIHPALQRELDQIPAGQLTFLQTQYGVPFSPAGFTAWFVASAKEAGLKDFTPHGGRKAGSRRLAEADVTPSQIMAVTGHKNLSEVTLYTQAVDQERLAEQAFAKLEKGTKTSNQGNA